MKSVDFHSGKIKVFFMIDIIIRGYDISGIFLNDDIIITDYNKNRIVIHDNIGKKTKKNHIPDNPTDITKVNDQTVAVASNANKIFIINVKPVSLVKTIHIAVPIWGLCLKEDEYITANNSTIYCLKAHTGARIKE